MAIYHLSASVISRGKGQSCVASASYRAAENLHDDFYGKSYDYTPKMKSDNVESQIIAPEDSPEWVYNRESLWNTVEFREKRRDSQLAREFNLALPHELTKEQQKELVVEFVKDNFIILGMVADICYHFKKGNNHVHIMLTMRKLLSYGFGYKVREWNNRELLLFWRKNWANVVNKYLTKSKLNILVDHRSFVDRMLKLLPTVHLGFRANFLEKLGIKTNRGNINREVKEYNKTLSKIEKHQNEKKEIILNEYKQCKDSLIEKIDTTLNRTTSMDEFIKHMEKDNYKIELIEYKDHIVFTTPDGIKFDNKKLPEKYSKTNLEQHFKPSISKYYKEPIQVDYSRLYHKLSYDMDGLKTKSQNLNTIIRKLEKSFVKKIIHKKELIKLKAEYKELTSELESKQIKFNECTRIIQDEFRRKLREPSMKKDIVKNKTKTNSQKEKENSLDKTMNKTLAKLRNDIDRNKGKGRGR